MLHLQYKNFTLEYHGKIPVTPSNYFKDAIHVYSNTGEFICLINSREMNMQQKVSLLSGNENIAIDAMNSIIAYRKHMAELLENLNLQKTQNNENFYY